ncbi:MAG: hypothetical protein WAW85_00940 [Gordonia sp. (in: high G+C Gram-positive bacteria)]|uniref:hypothetical protein n=1 Tax=Gordonia sp. (in: high G+C Gram-positive bacteria) TaxID=84139 RepID=UPI003BB5FEC1
MKDVLRLDPVALGHLIARQYAVADALDHCAATLAGTPWVHNQVHREAAAALETRLGHLAERLSSGSSRVAGLAQQMTAQAAALTAADANGE